jgi:hypothetical protein
MRLTVSILLSFKVRCLKALRLDLVLSRFYGGILALIAVPRGGATRCSSTTLEEGEIASIAYPRAVLHPNLLALILSWSHA